MSGLALRLLLAAFLAAVVVQPGTRAEVRPRLELAAATGAFAHSNSGDGSPIFTAAGLEPGGSVSGVVSVRNTTDSAGWFSFSRSDVVDVPGPQGGRLGSRLYLLVEDVTDPAGPLPLYLGKLDTMPPRSVGAIAAGHRRVYRFTAAMFDSGPGGADNAWRGSALGVRYEWLGEHQSPTGDARAPRIRIRIPGHQHVLAQRRVLIRLSCDEGCTARALGTLTGHGSRTSRELRAPATTAPPGRWVALKLKLPRPTLRRARRWAEGGRRLTIDVRASAVDASGNRGRARRAQRFGL